MDLLKQRKLQEYYMDQKTNYTVEAIPHLETHSHVHSMNNS